ncbi:MAG: Polysaccharide transporter permease protein [Solirubrobacterales bacterium]|nr:Polysaccharide transporter permease protein [Solirubrobacterales bacterium]
MPLTVSKPAEEADQATQPETIRLQPTRGFGRVLSPRELWRYRDLAFQIAARDVTIRYRQTAFGAAWAILQPIAFMIVFSLVFGRYAGISPGNGVPYALFSLAALVPWMFFANSFLLSSESLVMNQALVSKIYFPRIFIPAGVVAAGCVDFGISLVILLAIVLIYGIVPSLAILALPLLIVIAAATALGAGTALSAINVRYRDVRYVVPFATQMWLFVTPIVYPNSSLSQPLRTLSAVNPMVGVVEGFRWAVLDTGSAPVVLMAISTAAAAVLLFAGLAYFDRVERSFADFI